MQFSVYDSLYSGKGTPPCLYGSVFVRKLYLVSRKQRVSFLNAFRSSHIVKANIDLSFFS